MFTGADTLVSTLVMIAQVFCSPLSFGIVGAHSLPHTVVEGVFAQWLESRVGHSPGKELPFSQNPPTCYRGQDKICYSSSTAVTDAPVMLAQLCWLARGVPFPLSSTHSEWGISDAWSVLSTAMTREEILLGYFGSIPPHAPAWSYSGQPQSGPYSFIRRLRARYPSWKMPMNERPLPAKRSFPVLFNG